MRLSPWVPTAIRLNRFLQRRTNAKAPPANIPVGPCLGRVRTRGQPKRCACAGAFKRRTHCSRLAPRHCHSVARRVSRNATKPIAVVMDSLQQCPPPPEAVRGCVMPEVVNWARSEAGKGTWPFDLVSDFSTRTKGSVKLDRIDVSGLDRVVTGLRADLDFDKVIPLAMTRPAVRGKSALVYVQFATTFNWLVLLTQNDAGWTVTTKIANGAGASAS